MVVEEMVATVTLTESDILTAVRAALLSFMPDGMEIIRNQQNRVSEPTGSEFITMTPITRSRLSTNIVKYHDGFLDNIKTSGRITNYQATSITIQIDCHGKSSSEQSQIISTLFRSEVVSIAFMDAGYTQIQPLYTTEPKQLPYNNAESQLEEKWSVDITLQANIGVTTPQEFADQIIPNVIVANRIK